MNTYACSGPAIPCEHQRDARSSTHLRVYWSTFVFVGLRWMFLTEERRRSSEASPISHAQHRREADFLCGHVV